MLGPWGLGTRDPRALGARYPRPCILVLFPCSMVEDAAAVESDTSVVSIDNEEVYSTDESGPEVIELD